MAQNPITIEALTALDAIDRRGSYAKAAEELDKATSALSYTVQKLEEQLGVTLFQRQGRRAVLTPSGKLLLEEGRKILGATHYLADQVKELSTGLEPRLRIGVESTTFLEPLFTAIAVLLEEHPNLEVDIQECVLNGGWESLEFDQIDLLVGAPSPVPLQKGFRAVPIPHAEMTLAVSREHPLARHAGDGPSIARELPKYRRVVTHDTARQHVMRNEGLTTGKQVLYVQNMAQKIQAQRAGLGVGHLPRKLIQSLLNDGDLVELASKTETTSEHERHLAWKITNKGKALRRLTELLSKANL